MNSWTSTIRSAGLGAVVAAALALVLMIGSGTAQADLSLDAAEATITVDGDNADWAAITGLDVTLAQPDYTGTDFDVPNALPDLASTVKVAIDDQNIYVLFEVSDDYDFDPADHSLSASGNVMFLIDPAAGPHMGAGDDDFEAGLGTVDIWHWEMDCDRTVTSGGGDAGSGDDPDCNLDDEFSTDPEEREDDGGGDTPNAAAENSLSGVWGHTNLAGGIGAAGTWIFEYSRPLQTGDPEDAQFAAGGTAKMALAYFDADEGLEGWTAEGHATSAGEGWILVNLPGAAQDTPTPGPTSSPGAVPAGGGAPGNDGSGIVTPLLLVLALGSASVVAGFAALYLRVSSRSA